LDQKTRRYGDLAIQNQFWNAKAGFLMGDSLALNDKNGNDSDQTTNYQKRNQENDEVLQSCTFSTLTGSINFFSARNLSWVSILSPHGRFSKKTGLSVGIPD